MKKLPAPWERRKLKLMMQAGKKLGWLGVIGVGILLSMTKAWAADEGPFPLGGPLAGRGKGGRASAELNGQWAAGERLAGARARVVVSEQERESWSVFARNSALWLSSSVAPVLWSPDLGVGFQKNLAERESIGGTFSVGSPSNEPFSSWQEVKVQLNLFYLKPANATDSWLFGLNYSNRRGFLQNIPIPGFAYFMTSEDRKWMASLGIPTFLNWNFTGHWWVKASVLLPPVASLELSQTQLKPVRLYGVLQWAYQDYLISHRSNSREQFFFEQKKAALGVSTPLNRVLAIDLSGGYLFGRRTFTAESFFKSKRDLSDRSASGFGALALSARF